MSRRAVRWVLWAIFCLALPLPYFMIEAGRVPLASLLVFAALTVPLAFTDPSLTTRVIGSLFAVQAALYAWLLYIAARWLSRRIPPTRRAVTVIAVAAAVLLLALCAVYVAPLSHGPGTTNWFGLWD